MTNDSTNRVESQLPAADGSEKAGNGGLALSLDSGSGGAITVPPDLPNGKAVDWALKKCRDRFSRQNNPPSSVVVKRAGYADVTTSTTDTVDGRKDKLRTAWTEPTTTPPETPESEPIPLEGSTGFEGVAVGCAVRLPAPGFDLGGAMPAYMNWRRSLGALNAVTRATNLGASETLIAATTYNAAGWRVLPWHYTTDAKGKPRKMPMVRAWYERATHDTGDLIEWFNAPAGSWFHGASVGIAAGPSANGKELVVLDIDVKGGKNGFHVLSALSVEHGELPSTLTQTTPSGGMHLLFYAPAGSNIHRKAPAFSELGDGFDVLGINGYIGADAGLGYRWANDVPVADLPADWVERLKVECAKGSASVKSVPALVFDGNPEPLTDHDIADIRSVTGSDAHGITPTIDIDGDQSWFDMGASLKRYGQVGYELFLDASKQSKYWDEAECAATWERFDGSKTKASIFHMAEKVNPAWVNPSTVRAQQAAQAKADQEQAEKEARLAEFLPGVTIPAYIPRNETPTLPVDAVSDDRALAEQARSIAKGEEVWVRVQAGENINKLESNACFVAGMLTMNEAMVLHHIKANPLRSNRSDVRGAVMHTDGTKPKKANELKVDMIAVDWLWGTADAVMRMASNMLFERNAPVGSTLSDTEKALIRRVFELSALGAWWAERKEGGLNLEGAVNNGLRLAKVFDSGNKYAGGSALGSSSSGLDFSAANTLPPGAGLRKLSWIDKELTNVGAVGGLEEFCTSDQIEGLLAAYGCTAVFDEMHWKTIVHGLPKRFDKLDHVTQGVRELAAHHGTYWRKADVVAALKLLGTGTRYHPALEWVRSVPWDGIDRFQALLDTVTVAKDYQAFWPIALYRFSMGAVRCLAKPGGMKGIPTIVFYEPLGGSGKDMWQSALCPEEFTTSPAGFKPSDLNWKLAALDGWICVMPEITTASTKHSVEEAKAYLTASTHSYPDKYEMDVNQRPVRTVNIASTNQQDFLTDRSGNNRRFSPIQVRKVNYRHGIDMQQYWAQMLSTFETAWDNGDEQAHQFWFTDVEAAIQKEVTALHVVGDALEHDIKALWDFDNDEWRADPTDMRWAVPQHVVKRLVDPEKLQEVGVKPQVFEIRLARELARLGVEKVRNRERGAKNATAHYLMPPHRKKA